MKHDENLLERFLEKWDVLPELFAFEEPVSVLVPNEVVEGVAGFGKAIFLEKLFDFLAGLGDFTADPVFAIALDFELFALIWGVIDHILDEAGDVPELVAEVAASDNLGAREGLVDAGAAASDKTEA